MSRWLSAVCAAGEHASCTGCDNCPCHMVTAPDGWRDRGRVAREEANA